MEEKFIRAWRANAEKAQALGVRMKRTLDALDANPMNTARRSLAGSRPSDGFEELAKLGKLEYALEALVIRGEFGGLFSDEEANTALNRLLDAGYFKI